MSAIRTLCPYCISPLDLEPMQVLLLPAPAAAETRSYAFHCGGCDRVTVAEATEADTALLVAAGVRIEPEPSWRRQAAAALHASPFTWDDLIEFHLLLDAGDWFARLTGTDRHA